MFDKHWDESHATTMASTEDVYVEMSTDLDETGENLVIRRTVWRKARRQQDKHLLWMGDIAVIPRGDVPGFVRDIVSNFTVQSTFAG